MLTKRCLNVNYYLKDQHLYYSTIRPVVTYTCEAWALKDNVVQKLMIFESMIILRKIYGPTKLMMVLGGLRLKKNLTI
jgi:hypothetical protein